MKLTKTYEPAQHEAGIYELWLHERAFEADPDSGRPHYSISMPPPNETGTLSLGHALFLTLQDILARHARQQGNDVLWLPGTDHAAIAVNALIEKQLAQEGKDKFEVGREEFLRRTKTFVSLSRGTMINQMRGMGASCDWSRLRYTLDDALNRCVNDVFCKMYADGLIYRGHRIVNWDPVLQTTISDDEVVYSEEATPLYTLQYGPFQITTARPETKFGDKYMVMHPDDERYAQYTHGQTFEADWLNGPVTATVIKDTAIDPAFGTGVMTITPWHDHTDFEIAERHGLDKEQVIGFDGKLLAVAEEFAGLTIAEARPKIIAKLKAKGLLISEDTSYVHNIALNDRGKGVIEPQIKLQWFVDVNKPAVDWKGKRRSLKQVMQAVVRERDIAIIPGRFEKTYFNWIDNLRDWCISRQIWWGHRIPVWYYTASDGSIRTHVGQTAPNDGDTWEQDPDTLDTWFSSALWTWSTLIDTELAQDRSISLEQLLERSRDFQAYHPTNVMETGWDILFFWVARMILATTYVTGQVPFKTVYLHGMVRAADGKKMSKSRPESIIDPLSVTDKYGTDALRMALIMGVSPGNDQNWGWDKVEANRNFANKIWNIARYIETKTSAVSMPSTPVAQSPADHWILSNLQHSADAIALALRRYDFTGAYERLYHFIWDDLADWYIEASKVTPNEALLRQVLESALIMAHPFAPFVTETIWQQLGWRPDSLLAEQLWPTPLAYAAAEAGRFNAVQTVIVQARYLAKAAGAMRPVLLYDQANTTLQGSEAVICQLAGLSDVKATDQSRGLRLTGTPVACWLDVDAATIKHYAQDLSERQARLSGTVTQLEGRLANSGYVANAPAHLVAETRGQLEQARTQLATVTDELARLRHG